jgi:prophage regulatory protein
MKLIRLPETLARTGLTRTRLYVAIARGDFPQPVKLRPGGRAIGFPESEVDEFVAQRIAEREAA